MLIDHIDWGLAVPYNYVQFLRIVTPVLVIPPLASIRYQRILPIFSLVAFKDYALFVHMLFGYVHHTTVLPR